MQGGGAASARDFGRSSLLRCWQPVCLDEDSDYEQRPRTPVRWSARDAWKDANARTRRFGGDATAKRWSTEGQCEGKTRCGERCKVHRSSPHEHAEPLRRGQRFCAHHHPDKYTGVRCAAHKKNGKGQCRVWSGSLYSDAAPLRRGSPYCHHHRVRCAGTTLTGVRCTVTSSSDNPYAEPLRRGALYCAHHSTQAASSTSPAQLKDPQPVPLAHRTSDASATVLPQEQCAYCETDDESVEFSMALGASELGAWDETAELESVSSGISDYQGEDDDTFSMALGRAEDDGVFSEDESDEGESDEDWDYVPLFVDDQCGTHRHAWVADVPDYDYDGPDPDLVYY
jgi:hypothetical protein